MREVDPPETQEREALRGGEFKLMASLSKPSAGPGGGSLGFAAGLVALCVAMATAYPSSAETFPVLWLAEGNTVLKASAVNGQPLSSIPAPASVRAIAVDETAGRVWFYSSGALHARTLNGSLLFDVAIPASDDTHVALDVNSADETVWLSTGPQLWKYSPTGTRLASASTDSSVLSVVTDPANQVLWAATQTGVRPLELSDGSLVDWWYEPPGTQGEPRDDVDLSRAPNSAFFEIDGGLLAGWGVAHFHEPMIAGFMGPTPVPGAQNVAARADGTYVATIDTLHRISDQEVLLWSVQPFPGAGGIVDLETDPSDGSAWVAGARQVAKIGENGATLQIFDFPNLVHIRDIAIEVLTDITAPDVTVVSPVPGSTVASANPAIQATFTDDVSGVDITTVRLVLDGVDRTGESVVTPDGITLAPPQPLVQGFHRVELFLSDLAGNLAQAAWDFTVADIDPPLIVIEHPQEGSFTNHSTVEVHGTVTDASAVTLVAVNGTPAGVEGQSFAATLELEDGLNTILVVAVDAAGNQGVANVLITVDSKPPHLSVITPSEGQLVNGDSVRVRGEATDASGVAAVTVDGLVVPLLDGRFEADVELAQDGLQAIAVAAVDSAGNAAHLTRQVARFSLPELTITAPADLAFVGATTTAVAGTVGEGVVAVSVNGVPASLDGTAFLAEGVPLVEGGNTVTATAVGTGGQVATATIHLVRDLTPPRVFIHQPEPGAVIRQGTVSVSGLVNDIVPGTVNATEATVTVNGVAAVVANRSFFVESVPLGPGETVLRAVAVDESGNAGEDVIVVTAEAAPAARVRLVAGNHQTGVIGDTLPQPLVAELVDAAGRPVPDRPMIFRVQGTNGHLEGGRRQIAVTTDAAGRAQTSFTLGTRAGAANQVVEASAVGFAGPAVFTASAQPAAPAAIVVDSGGLQVGVAGQRVPRPLIAAVIDSGHNRLEGVPVVFRVARGDGRFADGSQETVAATDSDGRAIVTFTLDTEEGIANNVVEARLEGLREGPLASFVASGRAAGDPAATSISGVVLDNTNTPIAGATLRVKHTSLTAVTDGEGQFRIAGAPVGAVKLIIDGSTVSRPGAWPDLEFDLVTIAGRDNTVNMPIFLLPLDLENGIYVDETRGGTLTLPDLPGFALEIAAGAVTFPGGGRSGLVSVTVVHNDKVPMVPNFGQQPRLIVTIQPAGARFDPPARLTLPNVEGLASGEVTEMYSFDHDLGHFVSIGPATVSADAAVITSEPGVGIVKAGWHCGGNPATTAATHDCPTCTVCNGSTCVPGCGVASSVTSVAAGLGRAVAAACTCSDDNSCTVGDRCSGDGSCLPGAAKRIVSIDARAEGPNGAAIFTGDPVLFTAEVQHENCGKLEYLWDLGDGTTANSQTTTQTYEKPGSYNVSVKVRCDDCDSGTDRLVVDVECAEVEITGADPDIDYICPGCEIQFTATTNPPGRRVYWRLLAGGGGQASISDSGLLTVNPDAQRGALNVLASTVPDGSACSDLRSVSVWNLPPDEVVGGRSPAERRWIRNHPICAFRSSDLKRLCRQVAGAETQLPPTDGTMPNAWEHAYCNCVTVARCGVDVAKELWDAHEEYATNNCPNATMDLHNNDVGREVATGDEGLCIQLIHDAVDEGRLRWMEPPVKVGCPTIQSTP